MSETRIKEAIARLDGAIAALSDREVFPCTCGRDDGVTPPGGGIMCYACDARRKAEDAKDAALVVMRGPNWRPTRSGA